MQEKYPDTSKLLFFFRHNFPKWLSEDRLYFSHGIKIWPVDPIDYEATLLRQDIFCTLFISFYQQKTVQITKQRILWNQTKLVTVLRAGPVQSMMRENHRLCETRSVVKWIWVFMTCTLYRVKHSNVHPLYFKRWMLQLRTL